MNENFIAIQFTITVLILPTIYLIHQILKEQRTKLYLKHKVKSNKEEKEVKKQ